MAKDKKIEIPLETVGKIAEAAVAISKAAPAPKKSEEEKNPKWYEPGKTVLIRDKGVLKVLCTKEELESELDKKKNFDYRITDKTEKFMLIDYEKDEARFYVKALLAKVNKLKEVKMLYLTIFITLLIFILLTATFVILNFRITDLNKTIASIPKPPIPSQTRLQPINDDPFRSLGISETEKPESAFTGTQNHITNRLSR